MTIAACLIYQTRAFQCKVQSDKKLTFAHRSYERARCSQTRVVQCITLYIRSIYTFTFQNDSNIDEPVRISYHKNKHYNSLIKIGDAIDNSNKQKNISSNTIENENKSSNII